MQLSSGDTTNGSTMTKRSSGNNMIENVKSQGTSQRSGQRQNMSSMRQTQSIGSGSSTCLEIVAHPSLTQQRSAQITRDTAQHKYAQSRDVRSFHLTIDIEGALN